MNGLTRVHRWQLTVAFLGGVLLVSLLSLATLDYTTVLVPDQGGIYREGVAGAPRYLNPLLASFNLVDQELNRLLYRSLARFDEQGRVVPDLAEGWDISPDARVYTVRLKSGQFWQDGTPITLEDVLFTYRTLQSPDFPGDPTVTGLWQQVTIEPVDAWTVRFTLPEPFAPFLDELTHGLLPAHAWREVPPRLMPESQLNFQPVGNGPFYVDTLNTDSVLLKPNPYFSGPRPYLEGVEVRFYPDDAAVVEAYRRGEVDAIGRMLPRFLPEVQALPDVQMFFSPVPGYTVVLLNWQNPNVPFFQDLAVRQALLYAIDREALVQEVLHGMAVVAHTPFLPNTWAYTGEVTRYPYAPEKARALLEEAGWVDQDGDGIREKDGQPLQFTLLSDDDPTRAAVAQRLADAWQAIGVQAIPQVVTFAGLVNDFLVPRRYEAALVAWRLYGDPDPYPLWHSTQVEEGQNYSGWQNVTADELLEAARRTPDPNRRIRLYREFQQIFAEEVPALLLYHPVEGFAVRTNVQNVHVGPWQQPGDRYRTIAQWYIRVRRVPVTAATPTSQSPEESVR